MDWKKAVQAKVEAGEWPFSRGSYSLRFNVQERKGEYSDFQEVSCKPGEVIMQATYRFLRHEYRTTLRLWIHGGGIFMVSEREGDCNWKTPYLVAEVFKD